LNRWDVSSIILLSLLLADVAERVADSQVIGFEAGLLLPDVEGGELFFFRRHLDGLDVFNIIGLLILEWHFA